MTAILCAPIEPTRLERGLLTLSRALRDVAERRMQRRGAAAARLAVQMLADERARDTAASVHIGLLPR